MAAQFVASDQTVVFSRAPRRPPRSLERVQPRELTAVDEPIVGDSLAVHDLLELSLRLTGDERAQLEFFFLNRARGLSAQFTYYDVQGTAWPVIFYQSQLQPKEIAYNSHTADVVLRRAA